MRRMLNVLLALLLAAGLSACHKKEKAFVFVGGVVPGTINLTGGAANVAGAANGTGGAGGHMLINTYSAKGVTISTTGAANTGFDVPNYNPTVDLGGANSLTVTTDTVVRVLIAGANDPGLNVPYMLAGDTKLYLGAGAGNVPTGSTTVTGLRVNPGVTLTLGLNNDSNSDGNYDRAYLLFGSDVEISGKVRTADLTTSISGSVDFRHGIALAATNRDMGALYVSALQIFIRSSGSVITRGLDGAAASERGGDGGAIALVATSPGGVFINDGGAIDVSGGNGFDTTGAAIGGDAGVLSFGAFYYGVDLEGGTLVNRGAVAANGGNGSTGGATPYINIYASNDLAYNTGAISANGGEGTNGSGAQAGSFVYVRACNGSVYNSGSITHSGGDGIAFGGKGGNIELFGAVCVNQVGDVVNSGSITTNGGSAKTAGAGGGGGQINLNAYGSIRTSGALSANGGSDAASGSSGGAGGTLSIQNYPPHSLPVREIQISGNISLAGGAGDTGGAGGTFTVIQPASPPSAGAESLGGIELLGYASADLSGGYGMNQGGSALGMSISTNNDNNPLGGPGAVLPPGPIVNQINITAKGGGSATATGSGGAGGMLVWQTQKGSQFGIGGISLLENSGILDVSGGNGLHGGNSGGIDFYGHDGLTNSASIVMRGGDSTGAGGTGGQGSFQGLSFDSSGDVVNSGSIDATGGSGATGGNSFGIAHITGVMMKASGIVHSYGPITANGGAGSGTNGAGGNGGVIDLTSNSSGHTQYGSLSVNGGAPTGTGKAGSTGSIYIDTLLIN